MLRVGVTPVEEVIGRLRRLWDEMLEESEYVDSARLEEAAAFYEDRGVSIGEAMWVPEEWFYDEVLRLLRPGDVVFDVGAGDLRFALLASRKVRRVYAVEVNPVILGRALQVIGYKLPGNVIPVCADARKLPLPPDVTVVTILMQNREWPIPREWLARRVIYTRHDGVYVLEPHAAKSSRSYYEKARSHSGRYTTGHASLG
jgi:hypothetical protein